MASERGQATVETVAAVVLLVLVGGVALQLLVAGYAMTLADGAAEAGALALAAGRPAKAAARGALSGWSAEEAVVRVEGGEVTVRLRLPSPIPGLAGHFVLTSVAFARPVTR